MAKTASKKKKGKATGTKQYIRSTRIKQEGHTLITAFPMPNDLHDMVTSHQREVRDNENRRINMGESICDLLRKVQPKK